MLRGAVLALMLCAMTVQAAGPCPELIGRWAWGPVETVAAGDGRVLMSSGGVVAVLDISDPGNPRVTGSVTLPSLVQDLAIAGGLAYASSHEWGLTVLDLTAGDDPVIVGSFPNEVGARGIALRGRIAYLAAGGNGLRILNVSDPAGIVELGSLDTPGGARDVAVEGRYAYVADGGDGLRIIDVADPMRPTEVGALDTFDNAWAVAVAGDLALVTDYRTGLRLIDVSDPTQPVELAMVDRWSSCQDVQVIGTVAYFADGGGGLRAIDISNPSSPTDLSYASIRGIASKVAFAGDVAVVAGGWGGLMLVDISDSAQLARLSVLEMPSSSVGVAAVGETVYLANTLSGVRVFDISTPSNPVEVAVMDTQGAYAVAPAGQYTVVADDSGGMVVLELSAQGGPKVAAELDFPDGYARDVAVAGDYAYVALCEAGLQVVDLSTPTAPVARGLWPTSDCLRDLTVSGQYAYLGGDDHGLSVVDVSNPANPVLVGSIRDLGYTYASALAGSYLLLTNGGDGVAVIDVSTPTAPQYVSHISLSGDVQDIAVSGNRAYVARSWGGVTVLDVTDPTAAVELGTSTELDEPEGLAAADGLIVVTDYSAGFGVFSTASCGAAAPVAKLAWWPTAPSVGESVRLSDQSEGQVTTRSWSLSDGATGTNGVFNHPFAEPGFASATLTVSNANGSSSVTRGFAVRPVTPPAPAAASAGGSLTVVPAAAHVGGAEGTNWVTDLVLHNAGPAGLMVAVYFLEQDRDNTSADGVQVWVPGGESVLLADVVQSLFFADSTSGAILVAADGALVVSSRTYNLVPGGTYGQFIPGEPLAAAMTGADQPALIQLTENARYRTNIGFVNPTGSALDVRVRILGTTGQQLASQTYRVPPFGYRQVNRIISQLVGSTLDDAVAIVSTDDAGARFFTYASSADNSSGDPIYIAPVSALSGSIWVAAAAHAEGLNDTAWRTDLELGNPGSSAVACTVELMRADRDNSAPQSFSTTVPAGGSVRVVDALSSMFGYSGSGALRVTPASGTLRVSSRTYNQLTDSTYGQYIPAAGETAAFGRNEAALLVQLAFSPVRSRGFRTNIGLASAAGVTTRVELRLYLGDGTLLDTREVQLAPYAWHQETDVFAGLLTNEVRSAYAVVTPTSADALVFAYASVVDNRSGDPIYVPAVKVD